MHVKMLEPIPATPESVVPYGMLIDIPADDDALPIAFYDGAVRVYKPAAFVSDEDTEITLASINRRDMSVRWLERHFKHTQTFIPLSGGSFVMVMAPATDTELPDLDQAQALLFDGSAGFALHIGTWHEFPFARADDTRVVVLLRGEATNALMEDVVVDGEARSADLDKKDVVARLETMLRVVEQA